MSGRVTLEFYRRSLFLRFGNAELYAEWRGRGWPRLWTWSRDVENRELWLGRMYLCLSRSPQPQAADEAVASELPSNPVDARGLGFGSPMSRPAAAAPMHLRLVHSADRLQ
jgi:hypothetical protein